jgi:hypothetical protein
MGMNPTVEEVKRAVNGLTRTEAGTLARNVMKNIPRRLSERCQSIRVWTNSHDATIRIQIFMKDSSMADDYQCNSFNREEL